MSSWSEVKSSTSFCKYIYGWIGVVRDCYILFTSSKRSTPVPLSCNETNPIIFKSDEKVEVEIHKGSTTNEEADNFENPARSFSPNDWDSYNSEDIHIHSHCIWNYNPSGPFCIEA